MSLIQDFSLYIKNSNLFDKKDLLLLAVSGGADSTALCELCDQAGFTFKILHCNFQLRGEESERDELFVKSLAEKYRVEFLLRKFDTDAFAAAQKISTQVAARQLRYDWFKEVAAHFSIHSNARIVTAHHADDNIETMLMNFFKGTGIKGLRGIPEKQHGIVRPMLSFTRKEILSFLSEQKLEYVDDSSNHSDKYTRNYFRNQLIPNLQKAFPKVEENLRDNVSRFVEIEQLYREAVDFHIKKILEKKGNEVHIPVLKIQKLPAQKTILYEILTEFNFSPAQTNEVHHLLKSETGKYVDSSTHRIFRNRAWIVITPREASQSEQVLIEKGILEAAFQEGSILIKTFSRDKAVALLRNVSIEKNIEGKEWRVLLDDKKITFPLLLRKWKAGDYFYPLGMKHKKKINRFLNDQKLSLSEKEKVWVLESDKKIIWVLGFRIDDRYKVTDRTQSCLSLEWKC